MKTAEEHIQLQKTFAFLSKTFFVVTGAVIISSAVTFLLAHPCLNCTMVYWIVGSNILASWVYPTSVLIIGFYFILFGLKFGFRGVGLLIMVFGAFDIISKFFAFYWEGLTLGSFAVTGPNTFADLSDNYFWFQNAMMLGGFILAGSPKLRLNVYFLMTMGILALSEIVTWPNMIDWNGIYGYQVYEFALFGYVYLTAELRPLPARLAI